MTCMEEEGREETTVEEVQLHGTTTWCTIDVILTSYLRSSDVVKKKKKVVQKVVQKFKNSKVTSSRNPQVNDLNQLSKLAGDCLVNEFCSLK